MRHHDKWSIWICTFQKRKKCTPDKPHKNIYCNWYYRYFECNTCHTLMPILLSDDLFAYNRKWYVKKNGDCWCPKDWPEWALTWRNKEKGN